MSDVDNEGDCACGARKIWETSAPSSQVRCNLQTALKKYLKKKNVEGLNMPIKRQK